MSTSFATTPWQAARIEIPGGRRSWTVLDDRGDVVECLRHWIIHLEQTHASPNTIRAYVRHVVDFENFLGANGAGIHEATVALYDSFLAWTLNNSRRAIKSFSRIDNAANSFAVDTTKVTKAYDGHRTYKPFLEHISQRRTTRRKDRYLSGDPGRVQQQVLK